MTLASQAAPASSTPPPGDGPDPTFLRLHAETRGFQLGRATHPTPTPDGKSVLFLRSTPRAPLTSLYEFDVATKATRELLTAAKLLSGADEQVSPAEHARRERMRVATRGFAAFSLSSDGNVVLVSLSGRLYTLRRDTGLAAELATGPTPAIDPRFSPDGKFVAYVRERDLYVYDLAAGKETRLTESSDARVTNGLAEFVAQEEMERFSGYWWAPDGSALAFEEADNRGVETLRISDVAHPEAEPEATSYPRPGKANAVVRVGVVPRAGGKPTWIAWDSKRMPYLATVAWRAKSPLTLVVMTREQRDLEVLAADPKSGATTRLVAEHDEAWLNLDQSVPRFVRGGAAFLWSTERDGHRRLELRDDKGAFVRNLSPEGVEYGRLLHVDERSGLAWFSASGEPSEQHLYAAPLGGGAAVRITSAPGVYDASFGAGEGGGVSLYAETATTLEHMQETRVLAPAPDGVSFIEVGKLPSVAVEPPFAPRVELTQAGDSALRTIVVRPRKFDPKRRYPVWLDVYGGPHHLQVQNAQAPNLLRQWIADHGYIVVAADGRGTPRRGRAFERAIAGSFGKVPLEDQVAAVKALGARYHELDLARVGVVGWSFGGYMAGLSVLRRPDVFQVGVAGAPVVDWRDYDTCYTERYLGLPDENPAGYEDSSLLTHAAAPTSPAQPARPLLVIHGTADDNVYFFHSLKLADALLRAGKPFDLLPLAGYTHMVPDPVVREQMWNRILGTMAAALKP